MMLPFCARESVEGLVVDERDTVKTTFAAAADPSPSACFNDSILLRSPIHSSTLPLPYASPSLTLKRITILGLLSNGALLLVDTMI